PALAHGVARVAGGPAVDRAGAVRGVLRHVRGHAEQPDGGDEVPRVVPLVGSEGDPPRRRQGSEQLQRRGPLGVAAGGDDAAADGETIAVLHHHVAGIAELGFVPWPLRASRASGSVVEPWVVLLRRSPWKFTVGLPGSSGGAGGASFRLKLLRLAHASTSVPSTVKCSSESSPRSRAWATTRSKKARAISSPSRRSRCESATLAERFIQETCARQEIGRDQLTIHADRPTAGHWYETRSG